MKDENKTNNTGLRVIILLCLVIFPAAGCAEPDRGSGLREIPQPELSGLEPEIQEEMRRGRAALEALLASPQATDSARSEAFGQAGMRFHTYGLLAAAEAAYLNALQLAPDDFRWTYYLGQLYASRGEPDEAIPRLERAVELQPDYVAAWIRLAELHRENNHPDRAEPLYERAGQIDSSCAAARIGLGKLALARGDHGAAVEHLERALELAPQATDLHYPLGLAYRGLGQEETARRHLETRGDQPAALDDPLMAQLTQLAEGWRIHQNRGTRYFRQRRYREALVEFQRAVEAEPEETVVRTNLGSTFAALGDAPSAEREFRRAVALDPGNAMAQFNLATLLAQRGDDAAAIEAYQASLGADPELLQAHFNLANALRRQRRFDEAARHYRHVIERDSSHATARLAEALALIGQRSYGTARRQLEAALRVVPEDRLLRQTLARVLAASPTDEDRDGPRALGLARTLLDEARTLDHVVTYAMAAAEIGDFASAVEAQRGAIQAARGAGRTDLLPALEQNLDAYEQGRPCREPWLPDDPAIVPRHAVAGINPPGESGR